MYGSQRKKSSLEKLKLHLTQWVLGLFSGDNKEESGVGHKLLTHYMETPESLS